ncbi:MAG: hypothetical protein IJ390_09135 [Lachnospiraceae bacterium]|nr:hypothetical protein [Lachnospiraceae bacterium]
MATSKSSKNKSGKKMSAKRRKARQRRRIILFAVEVLALVVLLGAIVAVNTIGKMERLTLMRKISLSTSTWNRTLKS